ncbi:MAG: Hsp20/alpha crystallin family protein [candidate division Zixibacteria bacterium]|nr:Hsp20/alpha crystallin family protein [candidate division Zixibacteria bacterium]MCI0595766.1 Hsp20/alpha crystallin family protein [candidate division Zixibacteria bacterium]
MTKLTLRTNPIFDVDRLMSEIFNRDVFRLNGEWVPVVDMTENKDEVVVRAEVPGMTKEDVSVTLQDNVLTLRGEKKQEKTEREASYHRMERSYGSFVRSFNLPTLVQADKAKADYKDGVLTITLPKAEEAKPKEISISVN